MITTTAKRPTAVNGSATRRKPHGASPRILLRIAKQSLNTYENKLNMKQMGGLANGLGSRAVYVTSRLAQ